MAEQLVLADVGHRPACMLSWPIERTVASLAWAHRRAPIEQRKKVCQVVQAYILIQTEVGKAASVAEAIAGISGVALAEDVTGPYDVIARVEAKTVDELGKLVIAKIQDVPGITRTLTCTVVHV